LTYAVPHDGILNGWGNTNPAGGYQSVGGRTGGGAWSSAIVASSGGQNKRESCLVVDLGDEYTVDFASMWSQESSNGQSCTRGIATYRASGTLVSNQTSSSSTSTTWRTYEKTSAATNVRYIRFFSDANASANATILLDDITVIYC